MANKKRRKPSNRSRSHGNAGARPSAGTGTAERPRPQPPISRSRTEKKELARQQREAIRKRVERARRIRRLAWVTGIAAVFAIGVFLLTRPEEPSQPTGPLPGLLTTQEAWPPNSEQLSERIEALGLPPEGTTMHVHANVQIFVHGERVPVPANVGVSQTDIASLHTHEESGTVHVESARARTFTLSELFGVWGVRFTADALGGYEADADDQLRVFLNGQEFEGDILDVPLDDGNVVVVTFGTEDELPDPIPATFDFASVPQ